MEPQVSCECHEVDPVNGFRAFVAGRKTYVVDGKRVSREEFEASAAPEPKPK